MALVDTDGTLDASTWMRLPATIWRDRCAFSLRTSCLIDKAGIPWRPWSGMGKKSTGSGTGYDELTFMELLHNAITNATGKPKLLIRFVGTVAADGVVRGVGTSAAGGGAPSLWPITTTKMVDPRSIYQFKAVHVSGQHTWTANTKDTTDDRAKATEEANAIASTSGAEMGHGSLMLRHLSRQYELGDAIPGTSGRVVNFNLDAAFNGRVPILVGITWTFGDTNKTELVLDSPMLGIT